MHKIYKNFFFFFDFVWDLKDFMFEDFIFGFLVVISVKTATDNWANEQIFFLVFFIMINPRTMKKW